MPLLARLTSLFFAAFLLAFAGAPAPLCAQAARAQEVQDVFTVEGVEVDVTAQASAQAKEQALTRGQILAFRRLMERLVPRADWARLPQLPQPQILELVRDFAVESERSSNVRYIAHLAVRFKAEPVRALLRRQGLPFAETTSKTVVLVPLILVGELPTLFAENDPWLRAWTQIPANRGLVPFKVPPGDAGDIQTLPALSAMNRDLARLQQFAKRHGTTDAVIVELVFAADAQPGAPADFAVHRLSGAKLEELGRFALAPAPGEDGEHFLKRGATETLALIEENWKRAQSPHFAQGGGRLTASVPIARLADWVSVRDRLPKTSIVKRQELLALSKNRAVVSLHFSGSESQLAVALHQRDLDLVQEEGGWVLRTIAQKGGAAE